ncbi:MAG TPA: CDP-alcohol phosphatidyltransferase family protein [Candidatus Binataceae bacterium]|nr:CDP-alcohol phosphatidyltransferase family protein [Candidatus Binataceae bacterium]
MSTSTPRLVRAPAEASKVSPVTSARHLLNVPNFLTLVRIVLIPVFVVLLSKHRLTEGLYVFAAAAVTDSLDGTVARWFECKTELGAFLDPFADKLLLVSSFVVLTIEGIFPAWLLIVVAIRDVVVVFGYLMLTFFTSERMPVRPSYFGKASTFLQLGCVIGALFGFGINSGPPWWYALLYSTVTMTGISGLHYMYRGLVWLQFREPQMFE